MSLFTMIFGSKKEKKPTIAEVSNYFKTFTGYSPVFTNFGGAIYEIQQVRAAINARAVAISKLKIEINGTAHQKIHTALSKKPNSFSTWSQFLYRLSTILDVQNTAFIVPILDEFGEVSGLYPILPNKCELVEYKDGLFLKYTFKNGEVGAIEFEKCGVLTKFQYKDDFFGEKNEALTPTLTLIDVNNQGIKEAIKTSATYRFIAQLSNFSKSEDLKEERKRFNEMAFEGEGGGLLLFPNTYKDIKPIESKPFTVSDKQMEIIDANVNKYFGVNNDVLQNSAYGDKWSAFYEGAIEPFAIQLSEVLTNMFFTKKEQSNGNQVMITSNRLQYMSNQEKLNVSSQMLDRGIMNRDEVREIWNLPPLPDGKGKEYIIRGEYISADEKIEPKKEGDNTDE